MKTIELTQGLVLRKREKTVAKYLYIQEITDSKVVYTWMHVYDNGNGTLTRNFSTPTDTVYKNIIGYVPSTVKAFNAAAKKLLPKAVPAKPTGALHAAMKFKFIKEKEVMGIDYFWTPSDASATNKIISKLSFFAKTDDEEELMKRFNRILHHLTPFEKQNMSMASINTRINTLNARLNTATSTDPSWTI